MRWVSGPGLDAKEDHALTSGWPSPRPPGPQELAEARAGQQAQARELREAKGRQEELLRKLQEAQEREAAMANQTQALNSQLEEAHDAQSRVNDGVGGDSNSALPS